MPRKYKRNSNVVRRGTWNEDDLLNAMKMVTNGTMRVNEASRNYKIPSRTLRRRIKTGDSRKKPLGKPPALGFEIEEKLVAYIKSLQKAGNPPSRRLIRQIAYKYAEKLGIDKLMTNAKSKENIKMVGYHWLYSFLERHPDLLANTVENEVPRFIATDLLNRNTTSEHFSPIIDVDENQDPRTNNAMKLNVQSKIENTADETEDVGEKLIGQFDSVDVKESDVDYPSNGYLPEDVSALDVKQEPIDESPNEDEFSIKLEPCDLTKYEEKPDLFMLTNYEYSKYEHDSCTSNEIENDEKDVDFWRKEVKAIK